MEISVGRRYELLNRVQDNDEWDGPLQDSFLIVFCGLKTEGTLVPAIHRRPVARGVQKTSPIMITSVGRILIDRRRALNLTLDDVAHASRVARQNLRWLEADELTKFPNLAYALTFLRFYGGVLDLDVKALEARARMQFAMRDDNQIPASTSLGARNRKGMIAMASSVISAIAVSVILAAAGLTVAAQFKDTKTPPTSHGAGENRLFAGTSRALAELR